MNRDNQQLFRVYVSCECNKRLYIGFTSRPEESGYLGSFKDKSFKPTHALTLHTYSNKSLAMLMEFNYQNAWDTSKNPRFANRAKCNISSDLGFSTAGTNLSSEHRQKISDTICELRDSGKWKPGVSTWSDERKEKHRKNMLTNNPMDNPDSRAKCSQPGDKNGMYGKRFTEEFKNLVSAKNGCKKRINVLLKWVEQGIKPSYSTLRRSGIQTREEAIEVVQRLEQRFVELKSQLETFGTDKKFIS